MWDSTSSYSLHPNEYRQELHYYLFVVKLDRCVGSCNTLSNISNKVCVPNKTEDLNIHLFDMILGMNELEMLTQHISCECKCKFYGRKCNSNWNWNNNKCQWECKKTYMWKRSWNPATCSCENGKYLASIIHGSVVTCDEVIAETKTIPTNFNEKIKSMN